MKLLNEKSIQTLAETNRTGHWTWIPNLTRMSPNPQAQSLRQRHRQQRQQRPNALGNHR